MIGILSFLSMTLTIVHCIVTETDLTGGTGTFSSPNFPQKYGKKEENRWTILVKPPQVVKLVFPAFQLEPPEEGCGSCDCDFVTVEDSQGPIDASVRYCGTSIPSSFVSCGSSLVVYFKSDNTGNHPGFNATYSAHLPGQKNQNGECTAIEEMINNETSVPGECTSTGRSTAIDDTSTNDVTATELPTSTTTTDKTITVPDEWTSTGRSTAIDDTNDVTETELPTSTTITDKTTTGETLSFGTGIAIGVGSGVAAAGAAVLLIKGVKFLKAGTHATDAKVMPENTNPQNMQNGERTQNQPLADDNGREGSDHKQGRDDEDRRSISSLSRGTDNINVMPMGMYTNYLTVAFTTRDSMDIKMHTAGLQNAKPRRPKPTRLPNLNFDVTPVLKRSK